MYVFFLAVMEDVDLKAGTETVNSLSSVCKLNPICCIA